MEQPKQENNSKGLSCFEKYLTVWVIGAIVTGIILGKLAPDFATRLDSMAIYVEPRCEIEIGRAHV